MAWYLHKDRHYKFPGTSQVIPDAGQVILLPPNAGVRFHRTWTFLYRSTPVPAPQSPGVAARHSGSYSWLDTDHGLNPPRYHPDRIKSAYVVPIVQLTS